MDVRLAEAFAPTGYSSGTHRAHLLQAVVRTTGPILELGMGPNSTPALHVAARVLQRPLHSLENNAEWAEQYEPLRGAFHQISVVSSYESVLESLCQMQWGVVLVDQSPGASRGPAAVALAHCADVLVCHDTEGDPCYRWEEALPQFRYQRTFADVIPWTTLVSNVLDVAAW